MILADRLPPLDPAAMSEAQRETVRALAAGPRGGVKGPFIPLLRSPQLMDRLQRVGEYLRYHSSLRPRITELVVLLVSRQWTQQFEWSVHVPLALEAGVTQETVASVAEGRRPAAMPPDEEIAYDFCDELLRTRGVSEPTYRRAVQQYGEHGLIDLLGLLGYFTTVSMVMNAAHTPPPKDGRISPLHSLPL